MASRVFLIRRTIAWAIFLLLIGLACFGAYYIYKSSWGLDSSSNAIPSSNSKVVERLREIILLPENEEPSVAQLVDANLAKEQNADFYQNAQDGDYVIIYQQEIKAAILYRATENKIIRLAPLEE